MFKRNLFKRALPVILSVAMVFQSMPATALAAEEPARAVSETVETDSGAESGSSTPAEDGQPDTEDSGQPAESGGQSDTEDTAPAEDSLQPDTTPAEGSQAPSTAPAENSQAQDNSAENDGVDVTEASGEEDLVNTDQQIPAAEIIIDNKIGDLSESAGTNADEFIRVLDAERLTFRTAYVDPVDTSKYGKFQGRVNIDGTVIGGLLKYITIRAGDEDLDALKEKITFEWQVKDEKAEGGFAAIPGPAYFPANADEYRLKISLDKVDGICGRAEDYYVYVNVEKAEIELDIEDALKINPGSTVQDLKDQINGNYKLQYSGGTLTADRKIIKAEDKKLPISVYKAEKGSWETPLEDTAVLSALDDYVVVIDEIALQDKAAGNYTISLEESYNVTIGDLMETQVEYVLADPGRDIIYEYTGTALTVEDVIADIFVKADEAAGIADGSPRVTTDPERPGGERVTVKDAEIKAGWYTRVNSQNIAPNAPNGGYQPENGDIEGKDKDGNKDGFVYKPAAEAKEVGEYYIIWSYAGDEGGTYLPSDSQPVRVTIDPIAADVTMDVEGLEFYEGMNLADVNKELSKLTYGVYPWLKGDDGSVTLGTESVDTADFFGTSYAGDDESTVKTQYYRPVFELQYREAKRGDEEGKETTPEITEWTSVGEGGLLLKKADKDTAETGPTGAALELARKEYVEYEYRVRFTGDKAVYGTDGTIVGKKVSVTDTTTNTANKNYRIDVTTKKLDDNAKTVEVKAAEATTIDTGKIVEEFTKTYADLVDAADAGDGTKDAPATKIYDGNALFQTRAGYKQAEARDQAGTPVASDADEKLRYTWSFLDLDAYDTYVSSYTEEEKKYFDFDHAPEMHWNPVDVLDTTNPVDGSFNGGIGAGIYRLTVRYEDPDRVNKPASANVYFKVEQQEIAMLPDKLYVMEKSDVAAAAGTSVSGTVYAVPKNDWDAFYALPDEEKEAYKLENITALNGVNWQGTVKRKEKNEQGEPIEGKFVEAAGKFAEAADNYRRTARYIGTNTNYTTLDKKLFRSTGEKAHHELLGEIAYFEGSLYAEVDGSIIQALSKTYDGTPAATNEEVARAIKLYSDEAKTIPAEEGLLNTTDTYDAAKVNILWQKLDEYNNVIDNAVYETPNAVWGGRYRLVLRFAGSEPDENGVRRYAPFERGTWEDKPLAIEADANDFIIRPRDVEITPKTKDAKYIFAGETADTILAAGIEFTEAAEGTATGVIEKDKKFFTYTEIETNGAFDTCFPYREGTANRTNVYGYRVDKDGGYPAFWKNGSNAAADYMIQADGRTISAPENTILRYGREYTVKLSNTLASPLRESYNVRYNTAKAEISRGSADISDSGIAGLDADLAYDYDGTTFTIRPREAVKFQYNTALIKGQNVSGTAEEKAKFAREAEKKQNWLAFRIYAPKEFNPNFADDSKNFILENSVRAAGGYIIGTGNTIWQRGSRNGYARYITLLFPLAEETKDNKEFSITWEKGYTDTFKLADIVLESDLTKAVAPKSIAFNGVNTKMAVGETQQLDLKITKAQLGDVISIRYRIKDGGTKNDYISIDPETGVVTALREGKTATAIEAYPVCMDAGGQIAEVVDSKGKPAKAASTKITVNKVSAPSIRKIAAEDYTVDVFYDTKTQDGYRREFYLVDATEDPSKKKWKLTDFETAIDSVKNGQYKEAGFVNAPGYSYGWKKGDYSAKNKAFMWHYGNENGLGSLRAGHTYVVYVRNVSAARTLADGSVVELSHNGAVKNFTMKKSQVRALRPYFNVVAKDDVNGKNPVYVNSVIENRKYYGSYNIDLSSKSAQLCVDGDFYEREEKNPAAEWENINGVMRDLRTYALQPVNKDDKAKMSNYLLPKLTYRIFDIDNEEIGEYWDGKNWATAKQSRYATISNSGKISLKGVGLDGVANVWVYVRSDNGKASWTRLNIYANASSVTGKKVKMKVGDSILLASCLEYKDDKNKKIPEYRSSKIMITDEMRADAEAAGFLIEDIAAGNMQHDWKITAIAPAKSPFVLKISDKNAAGELMEEAEVSLTSAQLDPVKGLKAVYVDDYYITLNFTHPGNPEAFAVEVKDARGSVVETRMAYNNNGAYEEVTTTDEKLAKNMMQAIQENFDNTGNILDPRGTGNNFKYYTGIKKKTYAYTMGSGKFMKLSQYTISVTPVYGNQKAAKPAVTKAKTTNIPASRWNMLDERGGAEIQVTTARTLVNNNVDVRNGLYPFVSGNTYTLLLTPDNEEARDRVTDTLTWKSSNTKVMSIKANPGTYTATAKALNKGTTDITVTSKITKKVIARYAVRVKAVGNGLEYGGDYEPANRDEEQFYRDILAKYDPYYEGRLEVLTESVPLVLKNEQTDRTWAVFAAPSFGQYTFTGVENRNEYGYYDGKNGMKLTLNDDRLYLEAGQKVYILVPGGNKTLTVKGAPLARLTKDNTRENALEIKANSWVSFTAPEDNYYTFKKKGTSDEKHDLNLAANYIRNNNSESLKNGSAGLKAGETIFINVSSKADIYVEARNLSNAVAPTTPASVTFSEDNTGNQYVFFKAPVDGEYIFEYTQNDNVTVSVTSADGTFLNAETGTGENTEMRTIVLKKGKTVVLTFVLKNQNIFKTEKKPVTISVTVRKVGDAQTVTPAQPVTIKANTTEYVKFAVPNTTDPAKYIFEMTEGGTVEAVYSLDYNELSSSSQIIPTATSTIRPGDTILIKAAGAAGENAKDSTLSVREIKAKDITDTMKDAPTIGSSNDEELWYTFTAMEAGTYRFKVDVEPKKNDAGDDQAPTATLQKYNKVFDTTGGSNINSRTMKPGETVIFRLDVSNIKQDADGKNITSTATVSVTKENNEAKPLTTDKPEPVSLAKANDEALYSFTARTSDTYTLTWEKTASTDETVTIGDAAVRYGYSIDDINTSLNGSKELKLTSGTQLFIKVTAEADNAKGTLTIKSDASNYTELKSGVKADFDVKAVPEAGKNEKSENAYKFTVLEKGVYTIVIDAEKKEGQETPDYPRLTINGSAASVPYFVTDELDKAQTIVIRVRADGTDSKGTITISPVAYEPLTKDETVTVTETSGKYFMFTAPADGRYEFAPDTAIVSISPQRENGAYMRKNQVYKFSVTSLNGSQTVKIPLPKLIDVNALPELKEGESGTITVNDGEYKFYKFTAAEDNSYSISAKAEEGEQNLRGLVWVKADTAYNFTSSVRDLEKGDIVLVRMSHKDLVSPADEAKKPAKFKCTIKSRILVGAQEKSVTIKAGESADFRFNAYEPGDYTFKIKGQNEKDALSVSGLSSYTMTGASFNELVNITQTGAKYFTIRNNNVKTEEASGDTTVTISVSKAAVTQVAVDTTTPEVTIKPNESAAFELMTMKPAPQDNYTVRIKGNAGSKLSAGGLTVVSGSGTEKIFAVTKSHDKKKITVTNNGDAEAKVTVELKRIVPEPLAQGTDKTLTIDKGEYAWVSFTAPESDTYFITTAVDNENVKVTRVYDNSIIPSSRERAAETGKSVRIEKGRKAIYAVSYLPAEPDETNETTPPANVSVTIKVATLADSVKPITGTTPFESAGTSDEEWFKFTAPKLAGYTLEVTRKAGDAEETVENVISYYKTIDEQDNSGKYWYKEGDSRFIKVTGLAKGSYTLKVTENVPKYIEAVEIAKGETKKVEYAVEKDGDYRVDVVVDDCEEIGSVTIDGYSRYSDNVFKTKGDKIKTEVTAAKATSVIIVIDEVSVAQAAEFGKDVEGTLTASGKAYYSYEVQTAGLYSFVSSQSFEYCRYNAKDQKWDKWMDISRINYADLGAGDRVLVRVTGSKDTEYTISAGRLDVPEMTGTGEKEFEVSGAGDEKYFRFTADDNAYYTFSLKQGTVAADGTVMWADAGKSELEFDLPGGKKWLEKGRTGVVKASGLKSGKYTFTVTKKVPEFSQKVTVEKDNPVTVPFTAKAGGMYRFEIKRPIGVKVAYSVNEKNEISTDFQGKLMLMKNDKLVIKLSTSNAGRYESVINIDALDKASAITVGGEPVKGVFLSESEGATKTTKYFEFTGNGRYAVDITGASINATANATAYINSLDGKVVLNADGGFLDLDGESYVLLEVPGIRGNSYTVNVEKVVTELLDNTSEEKPLTLTEETTQYYGLKNSNAFIKFTAPKTGKYYISAKASDTDLTIGLTAGEVTTYADVSDSYVGKEYDLTQGQEVSIAVTNSDGDTTEKQFKLTIKEVKTDTALEAGKPAEGILTKNESVYYTFTAPKAGKYLLVKMENSGMLYYAESAFSGSVTGMSVSPNAAVTLEANENLYLKVTNSGNTDINFKLCIKEFSAEPLELDKVKTGTIGRNDKLRYEFTAPEKAEYIFSKTGYTNITYYSINEDGTEEQLGTSALMTREMEADEKIILEISANADRDFVLSVKKVKTTDCVPGKKVEGKAADDVAYKFTISEAGTYAISNIGGCTAEYKYGTKSGSLSQNRAITLELDAETTLTVKMEPDGKQEDFRLMVMKYEPKPLILGQTVSGTDAYYELTIEEDGDYEFFIQGDATALLNRSTYDYSPISGTWMKASSLQANEKIQLALAGSDSISYLTVKKSGIHEIRLDQKVSGTLAQGERIEYTLSSLEPGKYEISTDAVIANTIPANGSHDSQGRYTVQLNSTQDLKVTLSNPTAQIKKFQLTVSEVVEKLQLDTPVSGTYAIGTEKNYRFTATGAGNYFFAIVSDSWWITLDGEKQFIEEYLEDGQSYILSPVVSDYAGSDESATARYTLRVTKRTDEPISINELKTKTLAPAQVAHYKFTAPTDGDYIITVRSGYVRYEYYNNEVDEWEYLGSGNRFSLEKGKTLNLRFINTDSSSDSKVILEIEQWTGKDISETLTYPARKVYQLKKGQYATITINNPDQITSFVTVHGYDIERYYTEPATDEIDDVEDCWYGTLKVAEESCKIQVRALDDTEFVITADRNPSWTEITDKATKSLEPGECAFYRFTCDAAGECDYNISLNSADAGFVCYRYYDACEITEHIESRYNWSKTVTFADDEICLMVQNVSTKAGTMTLNVKKVEEYDSLNVGVSETVKYETYGQVKNFIFGMDDEENLEEMVDITIRNIDGGEFMIGYLDIDGDMLYSWFDKNQSEMKVSMPAHYSDLRKFVIFPFEGGRHDPDASYNHSITVTVTNHISQE